MNYEDLKFLEESLKRDLDSIYLYLESAKTTTERLDLLDDIRQKKEELATVRRLHYGR